MRPIMKKSETGVPNEQKTRSRTIKVINTANVVNAADGSLFPIVMPQIQASLGLSLDQVSFISSVGGFLQVVTTPIWGWANDKYSRKKVLGVGCIIWGILTIFIAFSVNFMDMLVYRTLTGIGLAVVTPTVNSLIADLYPPAVRGKAFGILSLIGGMGVFIGAIFATVMVTLFPVIWTIDSWRLVFAVWGVASIAIAGFVFILATDPPRGQMDIGFTGTRSGEEKRTVKLSDYKKILTNKTFMLICAQGISGSIPANALVFIPMWLEYMGFTAINAMMLYLLIALGAAAGVVFGGWLGDRAAKWSPNRGRIMIAQLCVIMGIPLVTIFFLVIPGNTSFNSIMELLATGLAIGFTCSWAGIACNLPIFSEIFEPEIRGSVFAVDRLFEGSIASFGTFFIGLATTAFGYQTPSPSFVTLYGQNPWLYPDSFRLPSLAALSHGIFAIMIIPWIICIALYSLVYFTYPKDYKRKREILEARAIIKTDNAEKEVAETIESTSIKHDNDGEMPESTLDHHDDEQEFSP